MNVTLADGSVVACRPEAVGSGASGTVYLTVDGKHAVKLFHEETPELRGAMEDQVKLIIDAAVQCLGEAPPELAQDIMTQGVHLVGGGALLRGLAQRLADETAVPVHMVDTPLEAVVQGAGRCLESFDVLQRLFVSNDG